MRKGTAQLHADEIVYLGIDLHRQRWHVTIRTAEIEPLSASIPGTWDALHSLLEPYRGHHIEAVYEAGYFGYWLHDRLAQHAVECIVTPPSLIPHEQANRVKTDRRDSGMQATAFGVRCSPHKEAASERRSEGRMPGTASPSRCVRLKASRFSALESTYNA